MTFDPFHVTAGCNLWHLPIIFVPCCHANKSGPLSVSAQLPVAWLMMENWVGPGNKASLFQHSHHKLSTRLLLSSPLSAVNPETSSGAGPEGMLKLLKVSVAKKTVSE